MTPASLFGQIVLLAKKFGGIANQEINLTVVGSGKDKRYGIDEAVDLLKEWKESNKCCEVEKVD